MTTTTALDTYEQPAESAEWAAARAALLDGPISSPATPVQASTPRQLMIAVQVLLSSGLFVVDAGRGDDGQRRTRPMTTREGFVVALLGARLGLDPLASLMGIDVIDGRASPRVATLHAIVLASGTVADLRRTEASADQATWVGARQTSTGTVVEQSVTFTRADADRAGLLRRKNYNLWTPDMLSARALSRLLRLLWPDVLAGVSSAEEALDGSEAQTEGEAIRAAVMRTTPAAETMAPPAGPRARALPEPTTTTLEVELGAQRSEPEHVSSFAFVAPEPEPAPSGEAPARGRRISRGVR